MKAKLLEFFEHYQMELQGLLREDRPASTATLLMLGKEAGAAGLKAPGFTKMHEQTLFDSIMPHCPPDKQKHYLNKAGTFFAGVVRHYANAPPERSIDPDPIGFVEALSRRNGELAQHNLHLHHTIKNLQAREKTRQKQDQRDKETPTKEDVYKIQLRNLSRQILRTQEEERKRLSRELHDVIAQALIAVKVHLATLKKEARLNISSLNHNIGTTQRLVARSARIVHQFARELRPMALDDLGLVPAIRSYVDQFRKRTGILVKLHVPESRDTLDSMRRTVVFRVVQEALINVDRHAEATLVEIFMSCQNEHFTLQVKDNGKSFLVENHLHSNGSSKRLGLLGMRERVDMVGGTFHIESSRGVGTSITVVIPIRGTGRKATPCPPVVGVEPPEILVPEQ